MPVARQREQQNERPKDKNAARFQLVDGRFSRRLGGRRHKSIVAPQLNVGASAPLVQGLPRSAPADRCLPEKTAELCSAWTGRRPVPTRSVVELHERGARAYIHLADAKLPAAVLLPPITPARKTIRFGVFEVDLAAGELRKNGSRIRLQEQPFQILACLLDRAGEVITREELRQKLWPADTFVDFDHSLNTAINKTAGSAGRFGIQPALR